MMWSPPQVGRHRVAQLSLTLVIVAGLTGLSGCASFAGVNSFSETASSRSTGPVTEPDFDDEPRVAVTGPMRGLIAAPRPFAWDLVGETAGRRTFQTASIGDGPFRVLIVGSVGGDDPVAIELVDQLAHALHSDNLILGGFQASVVRTLNPDGAATRTKFNALGEYINHGFPKTGLSSGQTAPADSKIPEARFLLQQIAGRKPDRVIHIRSVAGSQGVIGYDPSTRDAGQEAAKWLGFRTIDLASSAVPGSMERCLADSTDHGVLVFGIPSSTDKTTVWTSYGDALLNLMLKDDLATRDLARRRPDSESADRRNRELPRP